MKEWLKNKHHFGATLPLGAIVVAIILTAGLILQVKVLQQETHTSSHAQEVSPAAAPPSTLENGLISYWSFDDLNSVTEVVSTTPGTVTGTTIVDGKIGKARSFVDANIIDMGKLAGITQANTISVSSWVNGTNMTGIKRIFTNSVVGEKGGFSLSVQDGKPRVAISNGDWLGDFICYSCNVPDTRNYGYTIKDCLGNTTLAANTWYSIIASYDQQNLKIYVNGVLDNTCAQTMQLKPLTGNYTYIGGKRIDREGRTDIFQGNPFRESWNGIIDEVRVWNRVLADDEIKIIASGVKPGSTQVATPTTVQTPVALVTLPKVSKRDQTITFAWSFGSGATGFERVNSYEVGAPITQPLTSVYLNCTGQAPASPIPTGSCTIANVLSGQDVTKRYELRMFAKDGSTVIATSNPIELTD